MNDDDSDLEPIDPLGPPGPLESARGPATSRGRFQALAGPSGGLGARETTGLGGAGRRGGVLDRRGLLDCRLRDHRRSHERARSRARPRPATTTSVPSFGSDPFGEASGRFAAVVDGGVWLVDAGRREAHGVPGVPRARIVASSGWSLLVQSEDPQHPGRRFVVDGRSGDVRPAADGTWLPRIGGGWWIATDGELTSGAERVALLPVSSRSHR